MIALGSLLHLVAFIINGVGLIYDIYIVRTGYHETYGGPWKFLTFWSEVNERNACFRRSVCQHNSVTRSSDSYNVMETSLNLHRLAYLLTFVVCQIVPIKASINTVANISICYNSHSYDHLFMSLT